MKISTKGRYAVRVMMDLAAHDNGEYITLMDVAKRQDISEKYLEAIVSLLNKNHFLQSLRGKGGGYKLARTPREYNVYEILKAAEGSLAPVACLDTDQNTCERAGMCKTLKVWEGLDRVVKEYLEGISLEDLVEEEAGSDNYVI